MFGRHHVGLELLVWSIILIKTNWCLPTEGDANILVYRPGNKIDNVLGLQLKTENENITFDNDAVMPQNYGFDDIITDDSQSTRSRSKRYAIRGPKWNKLNLTWSLVKSSSKLDRDQVRTELGRALELWSEASTLKFFEVQPPEVADIAVRFETGDHGDKYPFDGPGKTTGHGFFPGEGPGGDAHFDDDENWTVGETTKGDGKISLFAVAIHTFGHCLGLDHSADSRAIMYPWNINFNVTMSTVPDDDRRGIQQIYGRKNQSPPNDSSSPKPIQSRSPKPTESSPKRIQSSRKPIRMKTSKPINRDRDRVELSDLCRNVDAISILRGQIFVFGGKHFLRRYSGSNNFGNKLIKIRSMWLSLPKNLDHVDAVYENHQNFMTVFFIGKQYWVFDGTRAEPGYPKPLTDLGLPGDLTHIDAATVIRHGFDRRAETYLFSGDRYWRFDEKVNKVSGDSKPISSTWKNIPDEIEAVLYDWRDGNTYFFKEGQYWRVNDTAMEGDKLEVIPRWLPCWKSDREASDEIRSGVTVKMSFKSQATGRKNQSPSNDQSSPKPIQSSPKPTESSPKPIASSPKPTESSPKPTESSPKPTESSPKPIRKKTSWKPINRDRGTELSDPCRNVDAISILRGEIFVFSRKHFLLMYPRRSKLIEIRTLWPSLPNNLDHVDAVYESQNFMIVFFIGKQYWIFNKTTAEPGYPKPLTDLGLPGDLTHIDAATVWGRDRGETYLFSGDRYWLFDEKVNKVSGDSKPISSTWKNIPDEIEAVLYDWKDGNTYFFKEREYWKVNTTMEGEKLDLAPRWLPCEVFKIM